MKITLLFCAACLFAANLFAQRVLVNFYTSAPNIPDGWPAIVQPCGTNSVVTAGFHTNWTLAFYGAYRSAMEPRMMASNAVVQLANQNLRNASLAEAVELFNRIPQGLALANSIAASSATIEASLASGTNTLAQVVVRIRQLNGNANSLNTVQSNVLSLFQKVGPVIKELHDSRQ